MSQKNYRISIGTGERAKLCYEKFELLCCRSGKKRNLEFFEWIWPVVEEHCSWPNTKTSMLLEQKNNSQNIVFVVGNNDGSSITIENKSDQSPPKKKSNVEDQLGTTYTARSLMSIKSSTTISSSSSIQQSFGSEEKKIILVRSKHQLTSPSSGLSCPTTSDDFDNFDLDNE